MCLQPVIEFVPLYALETRVVGLLSCCCKEMRLLFEIATPTIRQDFNSFEDFQMDPPFPYLCWEEVPSSSNSDSDAEDHMESLRSLFWDSHGEQLFSTSGIEFFED